jgi:hypothetical protein
MEDPHMTDGIFTLIITDEEAQLVAEALGFWTSDFDGVAEKAELDKVRAIRNGIRDALAEEPTGAQVLLPAGSVLIQGIDQANLESVADTLRESAEYGTEFDGILRNVADQLEGKTPDAAE